MLSLPPRPKWWIPTLLSEASLVRCGSREVSRARTWGLSEARSPLVITAVFTSDLHTLKLESDAFLMRPFPLPPPCSGTNWSWLKITPRFLIVNKKRQLHNSSSNRTASSGFGMSSTQERAAAWPFPINQGQAEGHTYETTAVMMV